MPAAPEASAPQPTLDDEATEPVEEPDVLAEPVAAAAVTLEPDGRPRAGAPLVRVLQWMNAPRRHLPPSARVIVDWVALSLIFWVPIVWLFALLVV